VVGLVIGILASSPVTQLLVTASTNSPTSTGGGRFGAGGAQVARFIGRTGANLQSIQTNVGWHIILYGVAAAIAIAIVGSVLPTMLITRIRPAEVMRSE
jgi:ABC-type lipoprotein release transport system permease subunit